MAKQIVADLTLDKQMLQDVSKKALRSRQRRRLAEVLLTDYRVSERRACGVVVLSRSVLCYVEHRRDDRAVRQRIREIAETRGRYGFPRIQILLRREGWRDNHKRTYRIYREEGLNLRSKRPRRSKMAAHRQERPVLTGPHQCWSTAFVSDQLLDGRRFRALTLGACGLTPNQVLEGHSNNPTFSTLARY